MAYYPQLLVVFIDEQGLPQPLPNDTVDTYNVTTATGGAGLFTDADGVIVEDAIVGASVGDVIELSHATYPLTMRFTLQATQEEAYTAVENDITTFVVDNLYTEESVATQADIYIQDTSEATNEPKLLGSVKAGETAQFPFQTTISKTMRVFAVSKGNDFVKTENAFKEESGTDVTIPATSGSFVSIFDIYSDLTTTGTIAEDLAIDSVPANMFLIDGDEVRATYRGYFAANGNDKQIIVQVDSNEIFDSGPINKNGEGWTVDIHMIRSSSTTLRVTTIYQDAVNQFVHYEELFSMDFTALVELVFSAATPDLAGDLILASAKAFFLPATPATVGDGGLMFFGDLLTFGGDSVLF